MKIDYTMGRVAWRSFSVFAAAVLLSGSVNAAQAPAKPEPDVLLLIDGEKLIGHLVSADAGAVTFKSDLAGDVKVDWNKIKELHSSNKFAVAQKGEKFGRKDDPAKVPQGTVTVADQKVEVATTPDAAPVVIPVANTQNVINQADFLRAFRRPRIREYWGGSASFGASFVQATQTSHTYNGGVSLVRTVPSESWISPRDRTIINFNAAYGINKDLGQTIKTNIIHGDAERDEYLNRTLFVFGQASFDHNFSQGLDLAQTYGGGFGFVAYKDSRQELNLKGQIAFINQKFSQGTSNQLVGAVFAEDYHRNFVHGIAFNEQLSVVPSFNVPNDYSANGLLNLAVPITKRINFTIGLLDSFLNDPPPTFRKNSLQFTTNLTYKIN